MAGIGFTLRRLLDDKGFSGGAQAFAFAAVIASGPWLTSSVTLALLSRLSPFAPTSFEARAFLALISYAFAFSLIGVGVIQMVASRYLADRLYEGRTQCFSPAFVRLLVPLLLVQLAVSGGFLAFVPLGWGVKLAAIVSYLALNGTWLAMVFLSAARDFRTIAWAFLGGWAVSLAAGLWGGHLAGLTGEMSGFAAGVALTFFVLLGRMDREFGLPELHGEALGPAFGKYWELIVAGLAYNIGLWIDKILFWYHAGASEAIAGPLRAAPVYDNAMFFAYLTIIPALALFLIRVETDFYDEYRAYFAAIAAHESFGALLAIKARMATVLRRSLGMLVKIQGTLTCALVLLAPEFAARTGLGWLSVFVFRAGVFGAFLHVLHLIVLTLLLYFDFRKEAAALAVVFAGANALFTLLAFSGGLAAYGFGYVIASAVTLLFGLLLLERNLNNLEFYVFMKQPL